MTVAVPHQGRAVRVLLGFGLFGAFWGAWGAALPAIQSRTGVSDPALGSMLLLIGVGALLSMRLTGALVDRAGGWIVPAAVLAFAGTVLAVGSAASAVALAATLLVLGALSGAFDVIINTGAVGYEAATGRPLVGLAHAVFSGSVVLSSAATGLARSAHVTPGTIFAVLAVVLCLSAVLLYGLIDHRKSPRQRVPGRRRLRVSMPLVALGAVCALANVVESAHQSWSARYLESVLNAPAHIGALGPSLFALATMTGRFATPFVHMRLSPRRAVASGAVVAAAGTALVAAAATAQLGLVGVVVAGLGTGICVPTILSAAGAGLPPERRAGSVGTVMTVAYLGFVAGPAFVGLASGQFGLRVALAMVAAVAASLAAASTVMPSPSTSAHGSRWP